MAFEPSPLSARPASTESAGASCVEQLLEQRRVLGANRFAMPRQLVVTCVESELDPIVTRLAPCVRLRATGLVLDDDLRGAIALARRQLGIESVVFVGHTRCDHVATLAPAPARRDGGRTAFDAFARMSAAAARAGRRFASARDELRVRLLELREDACLVAPDGTRAACFGVLYVAESGTTHVYEPDADHFALVG